MDKNNVDNIDDKENKEIKETKKDEKSKSKTANKSENVDVNENANINEKVKKGVKITNIIIGILVVIVIGLIAYLSIDIYVNTIKNKLTDTITLKRYKDETFNVITDKYEEEFYSYNIKIASREINKNYDEDYKKYLEFPYTVSKAMTYDEYVSYCESLNLATKYDDPNKSYIVLSGIYRMIEKNYSLAGVKYDENHATIYLQNNDEIYSYNRYCISEARDEILIFIIPTDNKIDSVSMEYAITSEEFDRLKEDHHSFSEPLVTCDKPIIYLYPEEETNVNVKLTNDDLITCSYPKYSKEGWSVIAKPNGDLIDINTSRNLYSLYYESKVLQDIKMTDEGFCVSKDDVIPFLEEKLSILGLTEHEQEEFIIYWLPRLEENKYNYIRFLTQDEINNLLPLEVNPKPDTIIRVIMVFKGLDEKVNIKNEQVIEPLQRNGFTLVEWGGANIK